MNKKAVVLSFLLFLFSVNFSYGYDLISYSSASSLKRELSSIEREIQQNQKKINSLKYSHNLSDYDKKRKIQKLQRENYYLKNKMSRIKNEYRRAIS